MSVENSAFDFLECSRGYMRNWLRVPNVNVCHNFVKNIEF